VLSWWIDSSGWLENALINTVMLHPLFTLAEDFPYLQGPYLTQPPRNVCDFARQSF